MKYAACRSIDSVAAATASRYIRCMLALPPAGELTNRCIGQSPGRGSFGVVAIAVQHARRWS